MGSHRVVHWSDLAAAAAAAAAAVAYGCNLANSGPEGGRGLKGVADELFSVNNLFAKLQRNKLFCETLSWVIGWGDTLFLSVVEQLWENSWFCHHGWLSHILAETEPVCVCVASSCYLRDCQLGHFCVWPLFPPSKLKWSWKFIWKCFYFCWNMHLVFLSSSSFFFFFLLRTAAVKHHRG